MDHYQTWLSFAMSNCDIVILSLYCILCQVRCLIVSIPDLFPLSYFEEDIMVLNNVTKFRKVVIKISRHHQKVEVSRTKGANS